MYVHWLLPPRRRLEERPQLFAIARTQLDDVGQRWQAAEDAVAMRREQTHLCPGDGVPRQPADRFEQSGAEIIVEVARRELARRQRQVVPHVGRELLERMVERYERLLRPRIHQRLSFASLNVA
jgi:hypothetical protein